jgi:hypothetical protein
MAEIRNLIKRFSYDEPYSKTCYKRVCTPFGCTNVPYPCVGMKTKVVEIYSVVRYPDEATPQQKAAIVACAATSVKAALAACTAAYAATTASTAGVGGIIGGVAACIKSGEVAGRTAFDECKRKSLPHNIARRTGWSIEQKKYNRGPEEFDRIDYHQPFHTPYGYHYSTPDFFEFNPPTQHLYEYEQQELDYDS